MSIRTNRLLVLVGVLIAMSATSLACSCFVAATPKDHCAVNYQSKVIVIRGLIVNEDVSLTGNTHTIRVSEVLFNNSPAYVYFNQEIKVSSFASCAVTLSVGANYWLRITVTSPESNNGNSVTSFALSPCTFIARDTIDFSAELSCGKSLGECDIYPCAPDSPRCMEADINCFTTPCPQRTCAVCNGACPAIGCGEGTTSVMKPGKCCPTCERVNNNVDCSQVACIALACADNQRTVTRPGECCPTCENTVDCSAVACPAVTCADSQSTVVMPGQCCPTCVDSKPDDCSQAICPAIACVGESYFLPGECCPRCRSLSTCDNVRCAEATCPPTQIPTLLPGACCQTCQLDCSLVDCMPLTCANALQRPGDCCPTCDVILNKNPDEGAAVSITVNSIMMIVSVVAMVFALF